MTTSARIRAADADRERTARRIQRAAAEGRLSLVDTEQRLGEVYAATHLDELPGFVADLPPEEPRPGRFPPPLRLHAALAVLISALLVIRWAASGIPFFWPVLPLFWLGVSLVAHAGITARGRAVPY
jgi:Domain of unknown function (DUF1707)